jgi:hypothetical protein
MRRDWPHTYAYLRGFEDMLRQRSGYKKYFREDDPFYAIYNVSPETMAAWKVAWCTMGTEMTATVLGPGAGPGGIGSRPNVFKNTVVFVAVGSEDEANYLAALLNCTWVRYVARASHVRGGKSSNATNIMDTVAIPKFDKERKAHRTLASLARRALSCAKTGDAGLDVVEHEIDEAAAALWSVGRQAQNAMVEALQVLA